MLRASLRKARTHRQTRRLFTSAVLAGNKFLSLVEVVTNVSYSNTADCKSLPFQYKITNQYCLAVCKLSCTNGGKCIRPDVCKCTEGFTGRQCHLDVNECKLKPCDHSCFNTDGSYYCTCKDGFQLQSDRQSCKKLGRTIASLSNESILIISSVSGNHVALEAGELDTNDIDYDEINHRLLKLEKSLSSNNPLDGQLKTTQDSIASLKTRIETLEQRNSELYFIREKLKSFDLHAKKMEQLVDILFKCRRQPHNLYCA